MTTNIEKIKQLEKKYKLMADNLIDAIWTVDVKTMKFDYITKSIEKTSGYTSDEYIEFRLQDRMTPGSFAQISALIQEELSRFKQGKRNIKTVDVQLIHKSGHIYWAEIRSRLYEEPGDGVKLIGITRDISRRKRAEQDKDDIIEKLEATLAEKEALIKENRILRALLPICSSCKRIRDENGKWWPMDAYIDRQTDMEFTHTICLDCKDAFYGDEEWYQKRNKT